MLPRWRFSSCETLKTQTELKEQREAEESDIFNVSVLRYSTWSVTAAAGPLLHAEFGVWSLAPDWLTSSSLLEDLQDSDWRSRLRRDCWWINLFSLKYLRHELPEDWARRSRLTEVKTSALFPMIDLFFCNSLANKELYFPTQRVSVCVCTEKLHWEREDYPECFSACVSGCTQTSLSEQTKRLLLYKCWPNYWTGQRTIKDWFKIRYVRSCSETSSSEENPRRWWRL